MTFLSQTAEYALRAMAHLATLEPGASARAAEVAEATSIPAHYLSKVMRRLVLAGLVESQKGHHGGFSLSRPPSRIRFGEILAAAGVDADQDHCAFGWGRCNVAKPCPLHDAWSELHCRYSAWASQTTLADIHAQPQRLVKLRRRGP